VSIYDFVQSVRDGATVPLYYESRLPELHIADDALGDEIKDALDKADLTEEEEQAVAKRFSKPYQLITNDDRLEKIAADVVRHFSGRGYRGKAMFIAIDKATAITMYDKVQRHWAKMLEQEGQKLASIADAIEREAFEKQFAWLKQTDMAVVVSSSQNEIELMAKRGLDIKPHRQRMVSEALDEKFKAADDPLRLVFVCAMWITGFDVPTCSTIYLDKPMKNHTLMQTIARANRTAPGKQAGLIADYVGVFRNLKKALAIYAIPRPGVTTDPVEEKRLLIEGLKEALSKALKFAEERGVRPKDILKVKGFERQAAIKSAADALLGTDEEKRTYLRLVGNAWTLFRAVLPDPRANEFYGDMIALQIVAERIRSLRPGPSKRLLEAIAEIERLIDAAVSGRAVRAPLLTGEEMRQLFDLSTIDFDKLAAMFKQGQKKTAAEILEAQAQERAEKLAAANPARIDLVERLQRLIDEYNTGCMNVERLFEELKDFIHSLDEEEGRPKRENLSPEELAIFDILSRPEPKLTKDQEVQVKKIARDLLARLKREKFILDWRLKATAKSAVREAIREDFDELPEVYDRQLWDEKVERTYQFVFERYSGCVPGQA
jgi:type I restriction enzyme R subunit